MADIATTSSTPAPTETDAALRQKKLMNSLLGRPAALGQGAVTIGHRRLSYSTHTAFVPVFSESLENTGGEAEAAVMATAYLLDGADAKTRPLCFAFNGGPGSASIWLQLGALGPKRVVVPDDGSLAAPPYAVEDNPQSWFEHFDMVFIDPPHTGWSVSAGVEARKKHLSVDGDIAALAEVMRAWLTQHQRWGSPVYLAGESYGTTRGAALALKLHDLGVMLKGLMLVSCAMDLQTLVFAPANELPYALFLPAFANVSQFHGLVSGSSDSVRAAAEAFVDETYAAALLAGNRLSDKRRAAVAQRVSELTGLPRVFVEEKNLRVSERDYFFEALRPRGLQVGRLDARATGPLAASQTREFEFDPGMEAIAGPYSMAAMDHFSRELNLSFDHRYQTLNREVNKAWNWAREGASREGFASTTPDLALVLRRNPHLRVFVASGRYDLGTPYSATDWSLAHLDIPAAVAARVQHRYYDAGHMMYTRQADLQQLKSDLTAWLAA